MGPLRGMVSENSCVRKVLSRTPRKGPTAVAGPYQVRAGTLMAAASLLTLACSGGPETSALPSASRSHSITATSQASPVEGATEPSVDGSYTVSNDGRELALTCRGEGEPTVIFEDGHPSEQGGIAQFGPTDVAINLARQTRVCVYDRAGWGRSDPAPNEPRDADDVIGDLRALLIAAGVAPPYVLVGASFGGMIVTYYAAQHPDEVAGVVLLDVPAPSADLSVEEIPELAWDHPTNLEHVDVEPEFETRFAEERMPIEAPLVVTTATRGQSSVEDQSVWLEISPDATQIQADGGHDIYLDDPDVVTAAIQELIDNAR
jgi:hypothetical protein